MAAQAPFCEIDCRARGDAVWGAGARVVLCSLGSMPAFFFFFGGGGILAFLFLGRGGGGILAFFCLSINKMAGLGDIQARAGTETVRPRQQGLQPAAQLHLLRLGWAK